LIEFEDIIKARNRISDYIYKTPLDLSMYLSSDTTKVYLKLECQQRLKSFKLRGALNAVLSLTKEQKKRGVAAISSGNHGAGVSYAAKISGDTKAIVFVPKTTPYSKVEKIKYYGAEIVQLGNNYDEAHKQALEIIKKEGYTYIDPCSDKMTIAGQGTIGMEILEANLNIDIILVPIGGGGIITGVSLAAKHIKPGIKIIGVQTSACLAMMHAIRDNICYEEYPTEPSICDALIGGVGRVPFELAKKCIDDILEVDEAAIKEAVKFLMTKEKIIAEPSSAIGIAALQKNPHLFEGKNVAIVVTGGNLDQKLMTQILCEEK